MDDFEKTSQLFGRENSEVLPPVLIPLDALSADALAGLIDEFIMREGTDYGSEEASLTSKQSQIRRQLEHGEVVVAFDPNTESATLMTQRDWTQQSG